VVETDVDFQPLKLALSRNDHKMIKPGPLFMFRPTIKIQRRNPTVMISQWPELEVYLLQSLQEAM
jgi:hypothetical protein